MRLINGEALLAVLFQMKEMMPVMNVINQFLSLSEIKSMRLIDGEAFANRLRLGRKDLINKRMEPVVLSQRRRLLRSSS